MKKKFFHQLVTSDFIDSFSNPGKSYGLQKLYVLLLASRDSGIQWFTPAPRFSIPSRGSLYNMKLVTPTLNSSVCVSDSSMLEISGIYPMDVMTEKSEVLSPCCSASKRRRLHFSFEETCDADELIWYQAPITFNGFK